jgi:hypothetical protein
MLGVSDVDIGECWQVYVKTSTVPRGGRTYRYLSLIEAHREGGKVRHELVCRLDEAEELRSSGQLDRIIAALRRHAEGHWLEAGELVASPDAQSFGDITVVVSYFSRLLLDRHFARLGDGSRSKGLVWRRGGTVSGGPLTFRWHEARREQRCPRSDTLGNSSLALRQCPECCRNSKPNCSSRRVR